MINETRRIIIDLYISCEEDFVKGLKIFEAIVGKQLLDNSSFKHQKLYFQSINQCVNDFKILIYNSMFDVQTYL